MSITVGCVYGMGNPLLDISAKVESDFLEKYSLKSNDAILAAENHMPLYADLISSYPVEYIAGGATQNSIRIAQWMLKVPQACSYVGCTGKDEFGIKLRECAEGENVKIHYLLDETTPTGTCAVLVNGNNRSLVANISAASKYKVEHLETPETWALVKKAMIFYISGFFATVSPPSILKVAQHAAATNKIFAMNLAAPFVCQWFKDPRVAALPYWDYIFGNESEAETFSESMGFGTKDIKVRPLLFKYRMKECMLIFGLSGNCREACFATQGRPGL